MSRPARVHRGGARRDRGRDGAADGRRRAPADARHADQPRRPQGRPGQRRPAQRAARARPRADRARRSTARARCCRCSSRATARSWRRSRTRSRACRWPTCSSPAATPDAGSQPSRRSPSSPDRPNRRAPAGCGSPGNSSAVDSRALIRRPDSGRRFALSESREVLVSSFLSDHGALLAVVCALLAVVYGVVTTRSLLALSPGNEIMQRLSAGDPGGRAGLPAPPVHGRSASSASSCSSR